jgi:proteasome lid subunit RPN8/RPN11
MFSAWLVAAAVSLVHLETLSHTVLQRRGAVEDEEVAAFVVMERDGTVDLVHWPRTRTYRSAHWKGPVPEGTIGIIHTHPAKLPFPSRQDVAEARRLGMPVHVVSRRLLCTAQVSGAVRCANRTHFGRGLAVEVDPRG